MKYWIACLLIFVSVLAHADSLEEIRAKIAWIATEFEQGKLTEKEALYESEAVSLRIEKLESQAAMKPSNATPILIQKVPEYTGNALLRQAAMPSITAPLYESSKSGFMTIFMRVFPYMVGLLLLTCLGGIALAFGYGGSFSDYFRERVSNHTAIIDSIDRGPTLASVMGQARAQGVIPQQLRTPQGVSPAPVNALVVRRPRRNTPHHSGEISI